MSDPIEDCDETHHIQDEHSEEEEEGYANQRARHDDSDASQSDADDADSDSDVDSDAEPKSMNSRRLLDLEAEEDNGSDDSDQESDEESDGSGSLGSMDGFINRLESDEPRELDFFPQFKRLPLEIRLRIWEFFCPDLLADGRVYHFTGNGHVSGSYVPLTPGLHLRELTEAARTVLSVHQQSRDFALRAFPDTFPFLGGVVPFNKEKDIILLNLRYIEGMKPLDPMSVSQMRNVALQGNEDSWFGAVRDFWNDVFAIRDCQSLKNVYFVCESHFWESGKILSWCASKAHHQYRAETFEAEPGLGEDLEYIYAWPNLENHPNFMQEWRNVLLVEENQYDDDYEWLDTVDPDDMGIEFIPPHWVDHITETVIPIVRPMIDFSFQSGPRRFEKLVRMADSGALDDYVTSDEENSFDDEDEPNEYESEGIDDSDVEEVEEHSHDDDDLIVIGDDSDDQGSDGGASTFGGFSPIQESSTNTPSQDHTFGGAIDLTHDDDDGAKFSSPEPQDDDESQTVRGSDSDEEPESRPRARGKRSRSRVVESDDEDEVVELEAEDEAPRRYKRKRVVDSDDEDDDVVEIDDEDAAPRKRSRIAIPSASGSRNRAPIVIPGDDSEDEIRKTRDDLRRSRAIIIDDDDDDDDDEEEEERHGRGHSSGSDEESESEDVEEEEASRPLSLMERLELHRRDNPIPGASGGDDEEDPDIEEMGEDDYDARNYNHFEDDDERMEPSTDDDLDNGGQIDFDSDGGGEGDGGYY